MFKKIKIHNLYKKIQFLIRNTQFFNKINYLFEKLEKEDDKNKLKFLLYVCNNMNNNLINNKNTIVLNIEEDEDLEIFNFEKMGLSPTYGDAILSLLSGIHNFYFKDEKELYPEYGFVCELEFDKSIKKIITLFEKLSYIEELDFISELIIRYDNETYFEKIVSLKLLEAKNGYDIAKTIIEYKKSINN